MLISGARTKLRRMAKATGMRTSRPRYSNATTIAKAKSSLEAGDRVASLGARRLFFVTAFNVCSCSQGKACGEIEFGTCHRWRRKHTNSCSPSRGVRAVAPSILAQHEPRKSRLTAHGQIHWESLCFRTNSRKRFTCNGLWPLRLICTVCTSILQSVSSTYEIPGHSP